MLCVSCASCYYIKNVKLYDLANGLGCVADKDVGAKHEEN